MIEQFITADDSTDLLPIILEIKSNFQTAINGNVIPECRHSLSFWIYCKAGANTYTSHILCKLFNMVDKELCNYINYFTGIYDKNDGREWNRVILLCDKTINYLNLT